MIRKSPSNKSPGPDGVTFEFYITFWDEIRLLISEVFKDCAFNTELTLTLFHETRADNFNS